MHLLTEALVEDKNQDNVSEVIGIHLTAEGVGDGPELGLEELFIVVDMRVYCVFQVLGIYGFGIRKGIGGLTLRGFKKLAYSKYKLSASIELDTKHKYVINH